MNLKVALIGRPNVGKSTLFNKLVGRHIAITAEEAGTTRDRLEREITLSRVKFTLMDVGGIEIGKRGKLDSDIQAQVRYAVENADLLLFLVDARSEITAEDLEVAELLRKTNKPVVFVANKFESNDISDLMRFTSFGLGVPLGISAIHKTGVDEFINTLTKDLRRLRAKNAAATKNRPPIIEGSKVAANVAIVGRTNVGKSSLVNKILGQERFIVSEEQCTTRDVNDIVVEFAGRDYRLLDTAGLRRPGKIGQGIDRFATGRTLNAIEEADVALLMLDGGEKVVAQDLHVAEKILRAGKGIVIVVNKVDLWNDYADDQERWLNNLTNRFAFARYAPVVMVSAKSGVNLAHIFPRVLEVKAEREKRIPVPELNRFIKKLTAEHAPSQRDTGRSPPKIYFVTQAEETPPTFVFFVNRPLAFHFSYKRYVENRLRETYGFVGTPIRLEFRERKREARNTTKP